MNRLGLIVLLAGFACASGSPPLARVPIDWQNVGVIEEEITIYVREKIYFCPACRAFLGVASWHSEG